MLRRRFRAAEIARVLEEESCVELTNYARSSCLVLTRVLAVELVALDPARLWRPEQRGQWRASLRLAQLAENPHAPHGSITFGWCNLRPLSTRHNGNFIAEK